jgi:lauroyl/myristoyl acyltransferase
VGSWLAQVIGLEVVVVVDAVAVGARQSSFDSVRRASGVILRRRDATRIADLEGDLRRGRVVLWMLDRTVRGPSLEGQLLGLPVLLPVAPYALAHRTGASLLCGVTTTRSDGRRKLFVRPRIDVGEYDAQTALLAIAEWLGDQIRQRPWQWHVPAELHQLTLFSACSQDGQPGSGEGAAAGRPASLAWG